MNVKQYIYEYLEEDVDSHLDAWKQRYLDYPESSRSRRIQEDLWANHDWGYEWDRMKEKIGREPTEKEFDDYKTKFIRMVKRKL